MWCCEVSPEQKKANSKDGNIHTTKLVPRVSPPTLPSHSWGEKKRVPKKVRRQRHNVIHSPLLTVPVFHPGKYLTRTHHNKWEFFAIFRILESLLWIFFSAGWLSPSNYENNYNQGTGPSRLNDHPLPSERSGSIRFFFKRTEITL